MDSNSTPDFTLIRLPEVAALAGVSLRVLRKHIYAESISPSLDGMPEPVACSRGRGGRLLWVRQDLFDWLKSQRTLVAAATPIPAPPTPAPAPIGAKRGRGRPRKIALAAQAGAA